MLLTWELCYLYKLHDLNMQVKSTSFIVMLTADHYLVISKMYTI